MSAQREIRWLVACAAGILLVTMGIRQSLGLFVSPLNTATGLGLASISLALAVGQFTWGAVQPLAGAAAERWGATRVLQAGLLLLALGCLLTPWMAGAWGLTACLGVLAAAGSGAGSFSVLMGAAASRLPAAQRGTASGIINAGGSLGQFLVAPLAQALILAVGWMGALWSMAGLALLAWPLVWRLRRAGQALAQPVSGACSAPASAAGDAAPELPLRQALRQALRDRSYGLLHLGFFTCGFHIAFLVTHLPGKVATCGLPASVAAQSLALIGLANVAGSLLAGACVSQFRSKMVLALMYGSRAVLVLAYLWAPKDTLTFWVFAVGLGLTWLATVPPTAAIVGKLFGLRHLGTLFGLTLLSHQVGGFLGAWLGGLVMEAQGSYAWMWWADAALAALAAVLNLPIREAPVKREA